MIFEPVRSLNVMRTLSTGEDVQVGVLAQNNKGVFFQYKANYLDRFGRAGNLSPYKLKLDTSLQMAPQTPHYGLHGVFADSLPDGWGLLLQDRVFRQQGISLGNITAMDRLAFVGQGGSGALSYQPARAHEKSSIWNRIIDLGFQAQALFDGQTDEVLQALVAAGSSGGARPKAQLYFQPGDFQNCRTQAQTGDEAWLVKFTSERFLLSHEEGVCEAIYLSLAESLDLQTPQWHLITAADKQWLAVKRFDIHADGRVHLASVSALLDADFRQPSLDYQDLIKMTGQLCRSAKAAQLQFKRAVFNLFASNQDDHSKNWAFLLEDDGKWQPAPFYDVTFSPHPYNEHATSFYGFDKKPTQKVIQQLAYSAGYESWPKAQQIIKEIAETVQLFATEARKFGVRSQTIAEIKKVLAQRYQENKAIL